MFWQSSWSYNYWCFYLFILTMFKQWVNRMKQNRCHREQQKKQCPHGRHNNQSFHCFEGHIQCQSYTSYKASFCLENTLPYNFYLDISQEKAKAEEKLMCLKLLFCRPRRCFSKQKHQPLKPDNLSSVPRVHWGRRADSLRTVLMPPTSTMTAHTYTQIDTHHTKMNTHTIIKVFKCICDADDRIQTMWHARQMFFQLQPDLIFF